MDVSLVAEILYDTHREVVRKPHEEPTLYGPIRREVVRLVKAKHPTDEKSRCLLSSALKKSMKPRQMDALSLDNYGYKN